MTGPEIDDQAEGKASAEQAARAEDDAEQALARVAASAVESTTLMEGPALPDSLKESPLAGEVMEALVRGRASTLLEDLYDARQRLMRVRAAMAAEREVSRAALDRRAGIFLRSVAAARAQVAPDSESPAVEPPIGEPLTPRQTESAGGALQTGLADPLTAFLDKAKGELACAREQNEARAAAEDAFFEAEIARASEAVIACAQSLLTAHTPRVAFSLQPVGTKNAVAWMDRPSPDDAVLLTWLLSGHLPTRYDALFDDALDDMTLEAATFFAEEGYAARPRTIDEADALCCPGKERPFVPFKAMIPFRLPERDFPRLRFINQGPVLQLLAREAGESYAPLMPMATAEAVAGLLIRLQVEGRIALAFTAL